MNEVENLRERQERRRYHGNKGHQSALVCDEAEADLRVVLDENLALRWLLAEAHYEYEGSMVLWLKRGDALTRLYADVQFAVDWCEVQQAEPMVAITALKKSAAFVAPLLGVRE